MDWKEIVALKPDNITEEEREAVFNALVQTEAFEKVDGKGYKKLFRIAHKLMQWKAQEVRLNYLG